MAGFQNPEMLALLVLLIPAVYTIIKKEERFQKFIGASRSLIILLLVLAAAVPYINAETSLMKQPEVIVLKDNSRSTDVLGDTKLEFEDIKVRERVIAAGNSSDLRQGMLRNLESNKAYLIDSDLQSSSSLDGVAERFRQRNSTLNLLKTDADDEAAVTIKGPDTTVPGAENRFDVKVYSTEDVPTPQVTLDRSAVSLTRTGNNTWSFTRSFNSKGSHTLEASIDVNDRYAVNNRYYKAVEVTEKPDILVIGPIGSLGRKMSKFYDVDYRRSVPDNLDSYYTVILTENVDSQRLNEHVIEGNGLVYTGDPEDDTMDLLPVKKVPKDQQTDAAKLILVIDISKSTGTSGSSQRIKQVAYNLVEKLPYNNKVGILPYNTEAYRDAQVTEPVPLSENRELLKNRIARLQPDGNSFHHTGLEGGKRVLNGTGNIILITDGKITDYGRNVNTDGKSRQIASSLGEVKLITVGVGQDRNKEFLRGLANRGNGHYLDAEESGRLQFQFAAGGAQGRTTPLVVVNPDHFITNDLETSAAATEFDTVEPRRGAKLLVTGTDGKPALTSWRYGLGRVAAFSAGDKHVTEIVRDDPLLVSRTVSWTVGDPKRKQDQWIRVESGRMPEELEIRASYKIGGFKRQADDLYTKDIQPESLGFHSVNGHIYAYNYPEELEKVGYNNDARELVRATGGSVYTVNEKDKIRQDIKSFSDKKTVSKKPLTSHLLLAALVLFLAEVGYRKVKGKK